MNSRILDLISSPDLIAETDLSLLKEEISKQPYAQSLRALYLLGTKKFDEGNFQKELSVTAAYTTDKKILYQLINGKIFEPSRPAVIKDQKISAENAGLPQGIPADIPEENHSIEEPVLENEEAVSAENEVLNQEIPANIPEENHKIVAPVLQNEEPVSDEKNLLHHKITASTLKENHSIADQSLGKVEKKRTLNSRIPEGNWLAALPKPPLPKKVITEGEVNRILFPGEENFLNEEPTEKIDREATAETGVLVTEKINPVPVPAAELPTFNTEKTETEHLAALATQSAPAPLTVENDSEVDAKLQEKPENDADENTSVMEHEKQNRDTAAEVLQKTEINESLPAFSAQEIASELENEEFTENLASITENSSSERAPSSQHKPDQEVQEDVENTEEVNFHTEESFMADVHFNTSQMQEEKDSFFETKKEVQIENKYELERKKLTEQIEQKMALNKKSQLPVTDNAEQTEINPEFLPPSAVSAEDQTVAEKPTESYKEEKGADEETDAISDDKTENKEEEEIQPLHISFFAEDVSNLNSERNIQEEAENLETQVAEPAKSNIPTFINTWQNWLQIDRTKSEVTKAKEAEKADQKAEVIEKFLVAAPKISRFKEDGTYTVQEKKDDISHLMTETLANLFWSQKLYSKAINGYHNLIAKHPEKEEYYLNQIQEILASRQK